MLIGPSRLLLVSAVLALLTLACGKKTEIKSSLSELEKAFPAAAAPAPGPPPAQADANDLINRAMAAARSNDYAGGVIALQAATVKPGVTADQVLAIQEAKQAMVGELHRRAARGDQAALDQPRAIE